MYFRRFLGYAKWHFRKHRLKDAKDAPFKPCYYLKINEIAEEGIVASQSPRLEDAFEYIIHAPRSIRKTVHWKDPTALCKTVARFCGPGYRLERLMGYIAKTYEKGLHHPASMAAVISQLVRQCCATGHSDAAERILEIYHRDHGTSCVAAPFNTLIKHYCSSNLALNALQVVTRMAGNDIKCTSASYDPILELVDDRQVLHHLLHQINDLQLKRTNAMVKAYAKIDPSSIDVENRIIFRTDSVIEQFNRVCNLRQFTQLLNNPMYKRKLKIPKVQIAALINLERINEPKLIMLFARGLMNQGPLDATTRQELLRIYLVLGMHREALEIADPSINIKKIYPHIKNSIIPTSKKYEIVRQLLPKSTTRNCIFLIKLMKLVRDHHGLLLFDQNYTLDHKMNVVLLRAYLELNDSVQIKVVAGRFHDGLLPLMIEQSSDLIDILDLVPFSRAGTLDQIVNALANVGVAKNLGLCYAKVRLGLVDSVNNRSDIEDAMKLLESIKV